MLSTSAASAPVERTPPAARLAATIEIKVGNLRIAAIGTLQEDFLLQLPRYTSRCGNVDAQRKAFGAHLASNPGRREALGPWRPDPNETYIFQVVLSSPSMDEIEKAKPAFYALLKSL